MQLNIRLKSRTDFKKKIPLSQIINRGYKTLFIVLTLAISCLVAGYMWLTNLGQQKGYVLNQQQKEIENLEIKNRELEKEVVKARSLNNIEDRAVLDGMKDEYSVEYVKEDGTVSVVRRGK